MPVASTGAAASGFHRGVHVAADVVDGSAHGPALVFDLDDGQVERSEQQVDGAPDQRGVDLVAVAVQRHGRDRGDLALLTPQERPAQQRRVRPWRAGASVSVVTLDGGGAGLRMHAAVILLMQPRGEQPVQLGQRAHLARTAVVVDLDQKLVAHGAIPPLDFPASLRFPGSAVHQLDVEHRRRPGQLPAGVGGAVVAVEPLRAAVVLTASCSAACMPRVSSPCPHRYPTTYREWSSSSANSTARRPATSGPCNPSLTHNSSGSAASNRPNAFGGMPFGRVVSSRRAK